MTKSKRLLSTKRWADLKAVYPTLSDVVRLAKRKLHSLWMGIDDQDDGKQALSCFEDYCRAMAAMNKRRADLAQYQGRNDDSDIEALEKRLDTAKTKAADAHQTFFEQSTDWARV